MMTTDLLKGFPALAALLADSRKRIVATAVAGLRSGSSPATITLKVRRILDELEPAAASVLSDVQLMAWLRGIGKTVQYLPQSAVDTLVQRTTSAPPSELKQVRQLTKSLPGLADAARSLIEKKIVSPSELVVLSNSAKQNSFWISGVEQDSIVVGIRDALTSAISRGETLKDFRSRLTDSFEKSPLFEAHAEMVFRTGIQTAYKEGRRKMETDPVVAAVMPYKVYSATHDGRVTLTHLALEKLGLNGTAVYRADDPMWQYFDPPWNWNCRCTAYVISRRKAAALGVLEAKRWLESGEPPENPEYRLDAISFRPDPDFVQMGLEIGRTIRMAAVHAPVGGISIGGQKFTGGEFIPGTVLKKASAEERAKLAGGKQVSNKNRKPPSKKAQRAMASATRVGGDIQRYAEEHNEPRFAKAIGGLSFRDNEPVDVVLGDGKGRVKHGIELKTVVSNKAGKITMKKEAMDRKAAWEKKNKATFHTVVIDDSAVFNAKGPGQHDESKRKIYYRRGYGSFRIATMHPVKNVEELKKLMEMKNQQLPSAAQRKAKP